MYIKRFPRGVIILVLVSADRRHLLDEAEFWFKKNKINFTKNFYMRFVYLLVVYKEYRNLLFYRLTRYGMLYRAFATMFMLFLPRLESLQIYAVKIGWNLYIEHGISTIVSAESIGEYCWINQQVTIGYNLDNKAPNIGNGVRVCAGAKVLGNITIGNNSIIAANAVVVNNVNENSVMAGVPAKHIKENTMHKLWI